MYNYFDKVSINWHFTFVEILSLYTTLLNFTQIFNLYSARISFSRQNLTYVDVRIRRLKSIPALLELTYLQWL